MTEKENWNTLKKKCLMFLAVDSSCLRMPFLRMCVVFTKRTQISLGDLLQASHNPLSSKNPPLLKFTVYTLKVYQQKIPLRVSWWCYITKRKKIDKIPMSMLGSLSCMCVIITVSCVNHIVEKSEMLTDPERTPLLLQRL